MFDISDKIFEAIFNIYDQISYKLKNIQSVKRTKSIESYKHFSPNIRDIFRKNMKGLGNRVKGL